MSTPATPHTQQNDNAPSRSGILEWMGRHEWSIAGAAAICSFLLGCIGFFQIMQFEAEGGAHTWWDPIYASLQLFIFEAPTESAGWPLYLQIARALAPMVLLYTAAVAIFKQVDTKIALYGLQFRKRRFVVVCGIGEIGYHVARDYCLNTDKTVVAIDRNPMNPLATELVKLGATVLSGDAMDLEVLTRARVKYAKEIFLCIDDDQLNIAGAKNIERLCRSLRSRELDKLTRVAARHETAIGDEPASNGLRVFLCVDSPDLYEVFTNHPFFESNSTRFGVRLFNRGETIARKVFSLCAPDMYYLPRENTSHRMHIFMVGFTALTRELILQIALTCHYPDLRRPRVTMMCLPERKDQVARFLHRYPHLAEILTFKLVYEDALTVSPEIWMQLQADADFSVAYVAMAKDVEGVLAARRLSRLNRLEGMPKLHFVACLNQQTYLAEVIDDDFVAITSDKSTVPEHKPIEYLETLDETISIDVIVNEALDGMARTLHNAYVETLLARGETREDNASLAPWSELPAYKKKANQRAAAHVDVKLRASGCEALPLEHPSPAVEFPLDPQNLEMLAQLEHRRWMADKYLAGYNYGEKRDDERMLHPDLIAWEELTEADREKDRDNIRQIPKLLELLGLKVCLARGSESADPD